MTPRYHVGFSGTRKGMSDKQKSAFQILLAGDVLHHGDCVGADADAHQIARRSSGISIELHPPSDDKLRAFCDWDEWNIPKPYLDRNRDIVNASTVLVACPGVMKEQHHGGTWFTIRYALSIPEYPVAIIWSNGQVEMRYGK